MKISPNFVYMKRIFTETFDDSMTPEMKYYAFDWDDNIVHMPTKIILKDEDDNDVEMSTEDFAKYRDIIGKKDFNYNGFTIVGYSDNPFRNFQVFGDEQFLRDIMSAEVGPAFKDFREAINNGSIFAIVTARGHNPKTLKRAVRKYIESDFEGIKKKELLKNLRKYRVFVDEKDMSDDELINSYLELNKYYPVSFGDEKGASNPELAKIVAMDEFVSYIKGMSAILNKKLYLKSDISNNFIPVIPKIGFSDDDEKNAESMKKHFENKPNNIVQTYLTKGGIKRKI